MRTALAFSAALVVTAAVTGTTPSSAEASPVLKSPSDRMLNPQPLPPRWKYRPYGDRFLNPQPLPPRWSLQYLKYRRTGDRMLNPQPLPPEPPRQLSIR